MAARGAYRVVEAGSAGHPPNHERGRCSAGWWSARISSASSRKALARSAPLFSPPSSVPFVGSTGRGSRPVLCGSESERASERPSTRAGEPGALFWVSETSASSRLYAFSLSEIDDFEHPRFARLGPSASVRVLPGSFLGGGVEPGQPGRSRRARSLPPGALKTPRPGPVLQNSSKEG